MKLSPRAFCLSLIAASSAHAQPVVLTDLSTWDDVVAAVDTANANGEGILSFKSRTVIVVDRPLPAITGTIFIEGNGATLKPTDLIHETLIQIVGG